MKENYRPFLLGSKFIIQPPNCSEATAQRHNLIMQRGAFGSGEHETTESCIEILEKHNFSGNEKLLDLGSGTGILSIAALLLGAGQSWCIDIEPEAVKSCQHNSQLNGVSEKIKHFCGTLDLLNEQSFDFVLANIYGDILLDVADDLISKATPGGDLTVIGNFVGIQL